MNKVEYIHFEVAVGSNNHDPKLDIEWFLYVEEIFVLINSCIKFNYQIYFYFSGKFSLTLCNNALSYEVQIDTCIKNECLTYNVISHMYKYYLYYLFIKEKLLY